MKHWNVIEVDDEGGMYDCETQFTGEPEDIPGKVNAWYSEGNADIKFKISEDRCTVVVHMELYDTVQELNLTAVATLIR